MNTTRLAVKHIGLIVGLMVLKSACWGLTLEQEFTFNRDSLHFAEADSYKIVIYKGEGILRQVGAPQLPQLSRYLLLPAGYKIDSAKVQVLEQEIIPGQFLIYPVQPAFYPGVSPEWANPDSAIYNSVGVFPDKAVSPDVNTNYWAGYGIGSVLLHPVQWQPDQRKMVFNKRIRISLELSVDGNGSNTMGANARSRELWRSAIEKLITNKGALTSTHPSSGKGMKANLPPGDYQYVIITNAALEGSFVSLRNHKISRGMTAAIKTVEEIYAGYPGRDSQEKIRNFIKDAYASWGTCWVLLGGDAGVAPARVAVSGENLNACDLYYAALDGDWDGDNDNIFGEMGDNVDLLPEVNVGRAPVNDASQAAVFINKVITYETMTLPANYAKTSSMLGYVLFGSLNNPGFKGYWGHLLMESIASLLPNFQIDRVFDAQAGQEPARQALNKGNHLVCHTAHSLWNKMGVGGSENPPFLYESNISGLVNGARQSIVYSTGCQLGKFDEGMCIGEAFVLSPNGGAVAFIGHSNYAPAALITPPGDIALYPGSYPFALQYEFFKIISENNILRIGQTLSAGKSCFTAAAASGVPGGVEWREVLYQTNLLGDPEMRIRFDEEESNMDVAASSNWNREQTNTSGNIRDIDMIDVNTGWAVGENGLVLKRQTNGTWQKIELGLSEYDLNAVYFLKSNASYGWIVGEKRVAPNKYDGVLRRTIDGGSNWLAVTIAITLPVGTAFKDVHFASNGTGYIACGNGRVLRSSNYGATWEEKIPFPLGSGDSYRWYKSVYTPDGVKVRLTADNVGTVDSTLDGINWGSRVVLTLPNGYYTWPANTNIPNPLSLAPGMTGAKNWGEYLVPLNHGYIEKFGALSQPDPKSIWLYASDEDELTVGSNGEVLAGGNRHELNAGCDLKGVSSAINMDGGNWHWAGGTGGRIYTDRREDPTMYSYAISAGTRKVILEWEHSDPYNEVLEYEIYQSNSLIGPRISRGKCGPGAYQFIDSICIYSIPYHYWIAIRYVDNTVSWFYMGYATPTGMYVPPEPLAPTGLLAEDIPSDHGKAIRLSWNLVPGATRYYIGRRTAGESDYKPAGWTASVCFVDSTMQPGRNYEYVIQSFNGERPSPYSIPAIGQAKDNIAPASLAAPTGSYDASTKMMTLDWQASTDDPNFGGYWVCPEPVGKFACDLPPSGTPKAYHVSHTSPLERTQWKWRVPDEYISNATTLIFSVTAMDRTGNIADWSNVALINTKVLTNVTSFNATGPNGGHRLFFDNTDTLHLMYSTNDSVIYQASWDRGYSWTAGEFVGEGSAPCMKKDTKGGVCTAWLNGMNIEYAYRHSAAPPETIPIGYDVMNTSTPALEVGKGDTVFLVYIQYGQIPQRVGTLICARLPSGLADLSLASYDTLGAGSGSPTIAIDGRNSAHIAWRYNGDIYWTQRKANGIWETPSNITNSGAFSQNPSLATFGDVHLVWQEGNDINHLKGNYGLAPRLIPPQLPFRWDEPEKVNTGDSVCVNPVFAGNYIAWSQETKPGHYNAYYSKYENASWLTPADYSKNPTQSSRYPQIAYQQKSTGGDMVTVWTEGEGPLYSLIARDTTGQITPQYAANVGGENSSIYTIARDGYLTYGNGVTVDYDTTELQYYLPALAQDQKQDLEITLYQENPSGAEYQYKLYVDDVPLGTVKVPSGQPVLFDKQIPNSVTHDGEGVLRIEKKKGAIVTCDKWQMFTGDRGGVKASTPIAARTNKPVIYINELKQNAPNPSSGKTQFRYQLASPGRTSLKMYNTLGQVVKTMVDCEQQPGVYSVNWDGRDGQGNRAANGVYFYRLNAGSYSDTKKLVMIR